MRRFILGLGVLWLSGCASVEHYVAQPLSDSVNKKAEIERLLWEQYSHFAPSTVEVTDQYFRVSNDTLLRAKRSHKSDTVRTDTRTIYYDSIAKLELYDEGNVHQVMMRDVSGNEMYKYYQGDPAKAKRLIDLLSAMKARSKTS